MTGSRSVTHIICGGLSYDMELRWDGVPNDLQGEGMQLFDVQMRLMAVGGE